MSFVSEIKRRNVVKVGLAYLALFWLLFQVAATATDNFPALPGYTVPLLTFLLALGLPIALVLAWIYEVTPEGVKATRDVPADASTAHVAGQRLNRIVTTLLALGVAFMAVDVYLLDEPAANLTSPQTRTLPAPPNVFTEGMEAVNALPLVAVLPCRNLGSNLDDARFTNALHHQLIETIGRREEFNAVHYQSMRLYDGSQKTPPEIALELGARWIVSCPVNFARGAAGESVGVTAEAFDDSVPSPVFERRYMRPLVDILMLPGDLAQEIADDLAEALSEDEITRTVAGPIVAAEALDLVASGDLYMYGSQGLGSSERALAEYRSAIEADPSYGKAYLQAANALFFLALSQPDNAESWFRERTEVWLDATIYSSDPAVRSLVRGERALAEGGWTEAEAAFVEALALSEFDDYNANEAYGRFLLSVGRADEALQYAHAATLANPRVLGLFHVEAMIMDAIGDDEAARSRYAFASRLGSNNTILNSFHLFRLLGTAREEEAEEHFRLTAPFAPSSWQRDLFLARYDRSAALRILTARFDQTAAGDFSTMGIISYWASYLNEIDLAIRALRASVNVDPFWMQWMWAPMARNLRATEEFETFVNELGLVDYWRENGWPARCEVADGTAFHCN